MPDTCVTFFKRSCTTKLNLRRFVKILNLVTTFEIANELLFAGEQGMPNLYLAYGVAILAAIQSGWLLKGGELLINANKFSNWLRGSNATTSTTPMPSWDVGQARPPYSQLSRSQKIGLLTRKSYHAFSTVILWASLVAVPYGEYYRGSFVAEQLLCDKDLLKLQHEDLIVKILAPVSGLISLFYSSGSEGAKGYDASVGSVRVLTNNKATCNCQGRNLCLDHTKLLTCSDYSQKSVGGFLGALGALDHGAKEAATILKLTLFFISYSPLGKLIFFALMTLDLFLQNFFFQGREFRYTIERIFSYLFGNRKKDYVEIPDGKLLPEQETPQLNNIWKIAIHILTFLFLTAPAFGGHFGLFDYTLESGMKSYYRQTELLFWQLMYCLILALVAATVEAFTESADTHQEIDKAVTKIKFSESDLEAGIAAPQMGM